jgi:hypothetical protein
MNKKKEIIELMVTLGKFAKSDGLLKALILKAFLENEMQIEADKFLEENPDFNNSAEDLIDLLKNEDHRTYRRIKNELGANGFKCALLLSIIEDSTIINDLAQRAMAMYEKGKKKYGDCYLFVAKMEKQKTFDLDIKSFIFSYLSSPYLDKDALTAMVAGFTEIAMDQLDANDFKSHIESMLPHFNN